jgi:L-malate glycosyltransferase
MAEEPGLKVLIAGKTVDEGYKASLKRLSEDLGIKDKVIFAGQRDDINAVLSALDIFVLPSRREGFSRALLEAMSCSLPVIASDVSGNNEAVINDETGMLVPFGDYKSLARGIEGLISDPGKRSILGANARKSVVEHFSIKKHVAEVQKLYDDILGI